MKGFFDELGKPKSGRIRLAVMDMWKPFRNATESCAPQAAVLYDKFHVVAIWAKRWIRLEKASTDEWWVKIDASSKGRNTRCCRAGTI